MTEAQLDQLGPDIPRDQWKRPLVKPPEGGRAVPYTRCTTVAGAIEDQYQLTLWKRRMVARGLSLRKGLLLRVVGLGPQPDRETEPERYKSWRNQLDTICDEAAEAAEASEAAHIGTALHAITDRLDRGQDPGIIPDSYKAHLHAFQNTTRHLTAVGIERFVVDDEHKIGGTFDRLYRMDGHPRLLIGDTKTSSRNLEYSLGKIEIQLAIYAHSQLYDPRTGARTPLGDIDLERAVVVALNAATGTCELIWIDIAAGWEALQLALDVRAWRAKRRPIMRCEVGCDLVTEAQRELAARIARAESYEELRALWSTAGTAWLQDHTEMAAERRKQLEAPRLTVVT